MDDFTLYDLPYLITCNVTCNMTECHIPTHLLIRVAMIICRFTTPNLLNVIEIAHSNTPPVLLKQTFSIRERARDRERAERETERARERER